jgi:hypothetical protein
MAKTSITNKNEAQGILDYKAFTKLQKSMDNPLYTEADKAQMWNTAEQAGIVNLTKLQNAQKGLDVKEGEEENKAQYLKDREKAEQAMQAKLDAIRKKYYAGMTPEQRKIADHAVDEYVSEYQWTLE